MCPGLKFKSLVNTMYDAKFFPCSALWIISAKFPPKLSDVSIPLREITTDQSQFTRANKHYEAFITIQQLIIKNPVLKVYNIEERVTFQPDTSFKVNSQNELFASKIFSRTQWRHEAIQREYFLLVKTHWKTWKFRGTCKSR